MPMTALRFLILSPACMLLQACTPVPAPQLLTPSWSVAGSETGSQFGMRAMSAGDVNGDGFDDLIVGAPQWGQGRGQAHLYLGSARGLGARPAWTTQGGEAGELWGNRVGQAGDVNGDGDGDVYVAAPGWRGGQGRVAVFYGSKQGLRARPDWVAAPGDLGGLFGDCTHPTGDLNGDGYDDLAIGAYGYDSNRGRVRLYLGSAQGMAQRPVWQRDGEAAHDWYGYGVGAAGDVNGDGFADLLAGAKYNDQGGANAGKAYLYWGAPAGPSMDGAWTYLGRKPGANASVRVSVAGDVNGDGFSDVLLTAPGEDGQGGELALFLGGLGGLKRGPDQRIQTPKGLSFFGQGACPAGDLDGDGFDDVAVHGRGAEGRGHALIYRGSAKGLSAHPVWQVDGPEPADRFAWWLAPAGDVDGDGLSDLVISAESQGAGRIHVVLGRQFRAALGDPAPPLRLSGKRLRGYLPKK
jgi:hypothetical protein